MGNGIRAIAGVAVVWGLWELGWEKSGAVLRMKCYGGDRSAQLNLENQIYRDFQEAAAKIALKPFQGLKR